MTYDEIIKALKNEIHLAEYVDGAGLRLLKDALDLITRQRTEIESLKTKLQAKQNAVDIYKKEHKRMFRQWESFSKKTKQGIIRNCMREQRKG